MELFGVIGANKPATELACKALPETGLIMHWQISLTGEAGELPLGGLHCIDENVLNGLSAEAFESIRQAGALVVAYCQLLSMQQLPVLAKLAKAHDNVDKDKAAKTAASRPPELNLEFLMANDTIKFS